MTRIAFGLGVVMLLVVAGNGLIAVAGANVTPQSSATIETVAVTAQDLAPAACAGMGLTNVVSGAGAFSGTAANDLITGSAGADTIDGQGGADCIVGGGGNDDLQGDGGNDVLLGGDGDDALDGGADTDVCAGGGQAGDTFNLCETVNP